MLLAVAVVLLIHGSAAWCPDACICDRFTSGEREVTCRSSSGSGTLMVRVYPSGNVRIECSNASADLYSKLNGLDVGAASNLQIVLCPLPPVSFFNFTKSIGVESLSSLLFQSFQNLSDSLVEQHFHGLTNLTRLRLYNNGFRNIPSRLLKGLTMLTDLQFRDNYLKLPSDIFSDVPQIKILDLGNNRLESLHPDLFQGLTNLKGLYLWGNGIKRLDDRVFENLTTLEFLDLQLNYLEDLPNDVFRDCISLKILNLSKNNFTTLPEGLLRYTSSLVNVRLTDNLSNMTLPNKLFADLPELESLLMTKSNLADLPEDLFKGSSSLTNLSMSGNHFTMLPELLLKDQVGLERLDLSENSLERLPDRFFRNLLSLKTLTLHHNHLTRISRDLFRGLRGLRELNMEYNQLVWIDNAAFSDLPKLTTVHFSYNNLTLNEHPDGSFAYNDFFGNRSPFHPCVELEYLYLANNSISEIYYDWRVLLLKLRVLDLRFNSFERLMIEDIHFLSTSISVDLSQNRISKVVLRGIDAFAVTQNTLGRKPTQIALEGNPLDCDCGVLELAQFANGGLQNEVYDLVNLALDDVQCASPPSLKGRKFTEVLPGELLCHYEHCPAGCDCWYRRYDLGMIVNCTARELFEIPTELPSVNIIHHNHTELLLEDNKITKLPNKPLPGYSKVTQLFLAGNQLSVIDTTLFLNTNLTVLTLDHNNLTHLPLNVLKAFNNFTSLRLLTLHANPWTCDCTARDLLSWMQLKFKQIAQLGNVNCSDGRPFSKLSAGELCPAPLALVLGCAVVAACGVICGALAALYYRFNHALRVWLYARGWCLWLVTEEELDRDKKFDAFVSFSQKDEDFVVNTLVPGLENCGLKLCLHYRDWIAGEWIPSQIARSVEASRRTLVVLSPNFLDSVWGRLEFRAAHKQALSEGRARVVMLIYGDVPPANELDPELRAYISVNTYVKWGDPWFWDKLRYALPHAPLPKIKKKVEDHLELIRPMDSPVNSPSTPPGLPVIPSVLLPQTVLQTPKDCIIPAAC